MSIDTFKKFDHLKNTANQVLYFDRNKDDSFEFELITLNENEQIPLEKSDLSILLPSGSKWKQLIGWRSIFCIPLTRGDIKFYIFGVEEVVPHGTRGAYPILYAYIFRDVAALYNALKKIRIELFDTTVPENLVCEYNGILSVDSTKPMYYKKYELWIMKCAEKKYLMNDPILFRTLILNEIHLKQVKSFKFLKFLDGITNNVTIKNDEYLIGSLKHIENNFSYKGKFIMSTMNKIPWK